MAVELPHEEISFQFVASGGPGGQHANKAATKAELRWPVADSRLPEAIRDRFLDRYSNRISNEGILILTCQDHRSRKRNVEACLARLQAMLEAVARPPKKRRRTRRTRASVERRLEEKRQQAEKKRHRQKPDIPKSY